MLFVKPWRRSKWNIVIIIIMIVIIIIIIITIIIIVKDNNNIMQCSFLSLYNALYNQIYFYIIPEIREYCQWETFNATCSSNEIIFMKVANYGRMRFGRCVKENHGNIGCSSNVLPQLDRKCSGRHTCQLVIPDPMLHNIHPCPKELVPYLEASYICLPGI